MLDSISFLFNSIKSIFILLYNQKIVIGSASGIPLTISLLSLFITISLFCIAISFIRKILLGSGHFVKEGIRKD